MAAVEATFIPRCRRPPWRNDDVTMR